MALQKSSLVKMFWGDWLYEGKEARALHEQGDKQFLVGRKRGGEKGVKTIVSPSLVRDLLRGMWYG